MRTGIIRETKSPTDYRTPLTPDQCRELQTSSHLLSNIFVEPSPVRCFRNEEYASRGISMEEDLRKCELLLGVKEVDPAVLIPDKTYMFFSHTIKKQPYNREMLQTVLKRNIRLIDYEVIKDKQGERLIAFGTFAGMVGAHNALYTYGKRSGIFDLPRMIELDEYESARSVYSSISFPPVRIVLTGTGRVGSGAVQVLGDMGIRKVPPGAFLNQTYDEAVFTQLDNYHYAAHEKMGTPYTTEEFYEHPERYRSIFKPYTEKSDIFINGIYWDRRAPRFFSKSDMASDDFSIQVIADITCDIAPGSSVPSTIRPSTIEDPVYGYDPRSGEETDPYRQETVDVMAIDNLPNELARDASRSFGEQFIRHILPELEQSESEILQRATIAEDGQLGPHFQYLQDYVGEDGKS